VLQEPQKSPEGPESHLDDPPAGSFSMLPPCFSTTETSSEPHMSRDLSSHATRRITRSSPSHRASRIGHFPLIKTEGLPLEAYGPSFLLVVSSWSEKGCSFLTPLFFVEGLPPPRNFRPIFIAAVSFRAGAVDRPLDEPTCLHRPPP